MTKKILAIFTASIGLLFCSSIIASSSMTISDAEFRGNCAADRIDIIEEFGHHFLAVFFTDMDAVAQNRAQDKKTCVIKYNVNFVPGNQLNYLNFFVDGQYQLSRLGSARLLISHRVVNNTSARTLKAVKEGIDPLSGDIHEITGTVSGSDIPNLYAGCGASIPLTTSVSLEAINPTPGGNSVTKISLVKEPFRNYVKLGRFVTSPCER